MLLDEDDNTLASATEEIVCVLEDHQDVIDTVTKELLDVVFERIEAIPGYSLKFTLKNGMVLTEKIDKKERRKDNDPVRV